MHALQRLLVAIALSLIPVAASATSCADPFPEGVPVVEGRIISVRQVERRILFWGIDRWQAVVTTVRPLTGKVAPRRFIFEAVDNHSPCGFGFFVPKVGDVKAFPIYEDEAGTAPARYSTYTAAPVAHYLRGYANYLN